MAPDRASSIPGKTERQATRAVMRLVEIISAQSAGLESAKSTSLNVPATLTSTLTRPNTSFTSATRAEKSSKSAASDGRPHSVDVPACNSPISVSSGSAATSVNARRAPFAAKSRLTSRPIVPPAPVTSTTRSFKRNVAPFSRLAPLHLLTWPRRPLYECEAGRSSQVAKPLGRHRPLGPLARNRVIFGSRDAGLRRGRPAVRGRAVSIPGDGQPWPGGRPRGRAF